MPRKTHKHPKKGHFTMETGGFRVRGGNARHMIPGRWGRVKRPRGGTCSQGAAPISQAGTAPWCGRCGAYFQSVTPFSVGVHAVPLPMPSPGLICPSPTTAYWKVPLMVPLLPPPAQESMLAAMKPAMW